MVFTNKYSEILMEKFPSFKNSISLAETIELFGGGSDVVNIHIIFTALTNYVTDELIEKNVEITKEEIDIYRFIEEMRTKFSDLSEDTEEGELDNAVCTCFLENLINRASANIIKYERFIPYLGEKSKDYCRSWDEFTGVKSPGLWDNDENK